VLLMHWQMLGLVFAVRLVVALRRRLNIFASCGLSCPPTHAVAWHAFQITMTYLWSRALAGPSRSGMDFPAANCNQAAFCDLLSLLASGICTTERLLHSTCFFLIGLLKLKCANTEFAVSCTRVPGR